MQPDAEAEKDKKATPAAPSNVSDERGRIGQQYLDLISLPSCTLGRGQVLKRADSITDNIEMNMFAAKRDVDVRPEPIDEEKEADDFHAREIAAGERDVDRVNRKIHSLLSLDDDASLPSQQRQQQVIINQPMEAESEEIGLHYLAPLEQQRETITRIGDRVKAADDELAVSPRKKTSLFSAKNKSEPPVKPPQRVAAAEQASIPEQKQIDEVVQIMRNNVEKVLERDSKLTDLEDKSESLRDGASRFEKSSKKVKKESLLSSISGGSKLKHDTAKG